MPQTGVLLKCELSTVAETGNNQAQFTEVVVADSTWASMLPVLAKMSNFARHEPTFHHPSVISYHQLTRIVSFLYK